MRLCPIGQYASTSQPPLKNSRTLRVIKASSAFDVHSSEFMVSSENSRCSVSDIFSPGATMPCQQITRIIAHMIYLLISPYSNSSACIMYVRRVKHVEYGSLYDALREKKCQQCPVSKLHIISPISHILVNFQSPKCIITSRGVEIFPMVSSRMHLLEIRYQQYTVRKSNILSSKPYLLCHIFIKAWKVKRRR